MATFEQACEKLGLEVLDLPALANAFALSETSITKAREFLASGDGLYGTDGLDIVAFGSLARYEMTTESDLDYLVIVYEFDGTPGLSRRALDAADRLRGVLGGENEVRAPGSTGVFGKLISATELTEVIGLQSDTNHSHTRRILLLEESVSLLHQELHAKLLRALIERYLEAKPPTGGASVPRFLLNDLARYWRTLTVDYQAKTPGRGVYSLRYVKLITSRKFTFASSVLALFAVALAARADTLDVHEVLNAVVEAFSRPPTIRFMNAISTLSDMDGSQQLVASAIKTLKLVDHANRLLGDAEWRRSIDLESTSTRETGSRPTLDEARKLGHELQDALNEIFFSEQVLPLTRKYLVF